MTRLLRVAAVAVLVGGATAVLTSCSSDPGGIVTESPSPTVVVTTPSPSPTASVTSEEELLAQIPENARGEDFQSASNFAKFFWSQYPRLFDDGDSDGTTASLWHMISDESCEFCDSALSSSREVADAGQHRSGNEFDWSSELGTGGLVNDGFTYVNLDGTISDVQTFDSEGDVVEEEAGFEGTFGVQLRYEQDHWVVFGAEFQIHE